MNITPSAPASSAAWFAESTRNSGESFVVLSPSAPEWVGEWVHAAHDGELPNDWRYETCAAIVQTVADGVLDPSEIAEVVVDTYNAHLCAWLAGDLNRSAYVDEWMTDFGWSSGDGVFAAIRGGQYLAIESMASLFMDAVCDKHREYAERCDARELEAHGFADWVYHGAPALD